MTQNNSDEIAGTLGTEVTGAEDQTASERSEALVSTAYVNEIMERALTYLAVGYPIHFSGPAGTGKTTLAFHVAAKLDRPVSLIHGDVEFATSDLVGKESGYRKKMSVDNLVNSVTTSEEEMMALWMNNRLTTACQKGHTLIYDEFNRSRPETNNALLSVLAEKLLNLPRVGRSGGGYLNVHPEFRAVFTSNPVEYAGTQKAQDALMDRLITINLGHYDRETEIEITMAKSGIGRPDAEVIVDTTRALRGDGAVGHWPTIRAAIIIAKVLVNREASARVDDPVFRWVTRDVLTAHTVKTARVDKAVTRRNVDDVIQMVCTTPQKAASARRVGRKEGHSPAMPC